MEELLLALSAGLCLVVVITLYSALHRVEDGQFEALYVSGELRTVLDDGIAIVPPFVSETYPIDPSSMVIETNDGRVDLPSEFEADVRAAEN